MRLVDDTRIFWPTLDLPSRSAQRLGVGVQKRDTAHSYLYWGVSPPVLPLMQQLLRDKAHEFQINFPHKLNWYVREISPENEVSWHEHILAHVWFALSRSAQRLGVCVYFDVSSKYTKILFQLWERVYGIGNDWNQEINNFLSEYCVCICDCKHGFFVHL